MPWRRTFPKVYTADGAVFTRYEETLDEPPSGTTDGTELDLTYTPVGSETLAAAQISGPTGRCRLEVSTDGGSVWSTVAGQAVSGAFKLRAVALPYVGDDSEVATFSFVTSGEGSDADWTG